MTRTFGKLSLIKINEDQQRSTTFGYPLKKGYYLQMTDVSPHVCITVKNVFATIRKSDLDKFTFPFREDICNEIAWFMELYPMEMDAKTKGKLYSGKRKYRAHVQKMENILAEGYATRDISLNPGFGARHYQVKGAEIFLIQKKMVLADFLGLGKSLTSILPMVMEPRKVLPALIVCQTHLTLQWKHEVIEKFTNLSTHRIPVGPVYKLPPADVYIITYSRLAKWGSVLMHMIKYIIFDEIQELRTGDSSDKGIAAQKLCEKVEYVQGLSHSPIYNYGIEMWNILNSINQGCVGTFDDFGRQWGWKAITNPKGLGAYLREKFFMLRRTDKEVGRELPQINTIIKTVEYDDSEVEKMDLLIEDLALSYYSSTNFMEKGQMAMEFDLRARMETGVAKATSVAALVSLLCENGKQVVLAGWHRAVYDIWLDILKEYNPVMYTGSENESQKAVSKKEFIEGRSRVLIISNRSGVGLDGLQYVCNDVVQGELDWSPKVHEQIVGRVNRDGQKDPVNYYVPVCDDGSDPAMIEILGIKNFQAHGITDPFTEMEEKHSDDSRIKKLAESYLIRKNKKGLQKLMDSLIAKDTEEDYKKAAEIKKLIDKKHEEKE